MIDYRPKPNFERDKAEADTEGMPYKEYVLLRASFHNSRPNNPISQKLAEEEFQKHLWIRRQYTH